MDDRDRQLLLELQREIPLVLRPFEALGRKIGIDSADVLFRIQGLKKDGAFSQLGTVLSKSKIGYETAVIAMSVPKEELEMAAALTREHPGIAQCSRFDHKFNFWCLLGLPPDESLESHAARIQEGCRPHQMLILRTVKSFKPHGMEPEKPAAVWSEEEKRLIRGLQEEMPLTDEPFSKIAREAGISENRALEKIKELKSRGVFQKFSALPVSKEKNAGTLILWQVPEEKSEKLTLKLAEDPRVKFCIKRTSYPELPYSIHAAVELESTVETDVWLKQLEAKAGSWPYQVLVKEKDYKKTRLSYFPQELDAWRAREERGAVSTADN